MPTSLSHSKSDLSTRVLIPEAGSSTSAKLLPIGLRKPVGPTGETYRTSGRVLPSHQPVSPVVRVKAGIELKTTSSKISETGQPTVEIYSEPISDQLRNLETILTQYQHRISELERLLQSKDNDNQISISQTSDAATEGYNFTKPLLRVVGWGRRTRTRRKEEQIYADAYRRATALFEELENT
jgi:hypothetical protein